MKILSIGNSFSQDAHKYLHDLAKREGVNLKAVNLYIGGCSLRTHYLNMLEDLAAYNYEYNGEFVGLKASIKQALLSENWDVVTLQQVSTLSGKFETYSPYIEELAKYVKKYCPHSKIAIHQTWAYAETSVDRITSQGFNNPKEMLSSIINAYDNAAKLICADGIIPCGQAMMKALDLGIGKIHRDEIHASFGCGRYLLALCWYKYFTKNNIDNNEFNELNETITREERDIIIKAVNSVL